MQGEVPLDGRTRVEERDCVRTDPTRWAGIKFARGSFTLSKSRAFCNCVIS